MSHHRQPHSPSDVLKILKTHRRRWLMPTFVVAAVALVYSLIRPATWEASQALTVRDEAVGGERLGKFHFSDDMKNVQETILELAKSHSVLEATLKQVGPPSDKFDAKWPTDSQIAGLQGAVKLTPPRGAEFGKTEVFYLQVQSGDRQRAIALATAMSDQLKRRFADLRDAKAQSIIDELSKTVALDKADLKSVSERLAKIDCEVGADLGELRSLADALAGDSPLRRSVTEMETELRVARAANQSNEELLLILDSSKSDPRPLLAAPSRLLETQPALRRLKDSLVDAQLRSSQLLGNMSKDHPHVIAAKTAEAEIADQLRAEVAAASGIVKMELHLTTERSATLERQLAAAKQRLSHLAEIRSDYAGLTAEVLRRTETLKAAENQLADARASQASAHTASQITPIDSPETGPSPIGPGRSAIVLGGAFGGFLLGLAIVFLTVQSSPAVDTESEDPFHNMVLGSLGGPGEERPLQPLALVNGETAEGGHSPKSSHGLSFTGALSKLETTNGRK